MTDRYAVGVDFGGTKVLAGVVDLRKGTVAGSAKKRTDASDGPDELVERLSTTIDEAIGSAGLPKKTRLAGIGVGIAGQVDSERGVLLGAPNLSQATVDLPLGAMLSKRFGVPAALLNDVQVAAIGEASFGAGRKAPDFLCVFVGTGIGGAIVRNGELVRGASGSAGEIGHIIVAANGRYCGCGGKGHLEAYASRTAITHAILNELRRGRASVVTSLAPEIDRSAPGGTALRSGVLAKAIEAGDELVIEAVRDAATWLGYGLASAIDLLNPSRIILGGGVIESVPLLFDLAAARARQESLAAPAAAVEIVRARLGDYSGVVGAAVAAARPG
jgi:glucokinase